ncbi:MAG: hypothetical protein AB1810_10475 [Pseudomonadota bacterium]
MPHLFVSISYHGFGHIAQTAAAVNALRAQWPALQLTIQCAAPLALLENWFVGTFAHQRRATDFGMLMHNAVDVNRADSLAAYRALHEDWHAQIEREAEQIAACRPDLVLANISYLSLAAADRAGIPAVGLCSLNWADILAGYCADLPEFAPIYQQMITAYNSARCFLRPTPGMLMAHLDNLRPIGPLARLGRDQRGLLKQRLGLNENCRLILVGLGGIPTELSIDDWPQRDDLHWLIPDDWQTRHPKAASFSRCGLTFIDLLASCDALLTKPGYGSFAEAACNSVPVLYVSRRDWPEEPYLVEWLHQHNRSLEISRAQLIRGDLLESFEEVSRLSKAPAPKPTGAAEAAAILGHELLKRTK